RFLGQALHHRDVVHLLQRAHPPPSDRGSATDDEDRAVAGLRLSERRGCVGDPGAGGDCGDAAFSRDLGPALRGKSGRLLVADVDDPDLMLGRPGQDRPDMPAVQREQVAGAGALQRERDQLAGVGRIAHSAIAKGMAGVLNAATGEPSLPTTMTPPTDFIAVPSSATAPLATAAGSMPCSSSMTIRRLSASRMNASPWPVPPTAPNRSSAKMPAPGIGESPMRPGHLLWTPPVETATAR